MGGDDINKKDHNMALDCVLERIKENTENAKNNEELKRELRDIHEIVHPLVSHHFSDTFLRVSMYIFLCIGVSFLTLGLMMLLIVIAAYLL